MLNGSDMMRGNDPAAPSACPPTVMPGTSFSSLQRRVEDAPQEDDLPAQQHAQVDVRPGLLLGEQVVRAEAEVADHRRGEHDVEPVHGRIPHAHVLRDRLHERCDRVHEQADRPCHLVRLAPLEPLLEDEPREDETEHGRHRRPPPPGPELHCAQDSPSRRRRPPSRRLPRLVVLHRSQGVVRLGGFLTCLVVRAARRVSERLVGLGNRARRGIR